MDYQIHVRELNLNYRWGDYQRSIFTDLNLCIPAGSFVSITGSNGSGKSSILKLILGLIEPDSGEIQLGERQVRFGYVDGGKEGQVAYLSQHIDELFFGETVRQELSFQRDLQSLEIQHLLSELGLDHLLDRQIDTLSGGEKQGIALVQFLSNLCPVLLLDEPSSYLDKHATQVLRKRLQRAQGEGRTILHATQFNREVSWGSHVLDLDADLPEVVVV